jgi:uncharacterized protein with FMN-binding domain
MKKVIKIILLVLAIIILGGVAFYYFQIRPKLQEYEKVRHITINEIPLSNVADGTYSGTYNYADTGSTVEVTVNDHQIENFEIQETGLNTDYAKRAAKEIVPKVINAQSNTVDVVSGATTSSKAYLKALEYALMEGVTAQKELEKAQADSAQADSLQVEENEQ